MSKSESFKSFLHMDEETYWASICELSADELYEQHAQVSRKKVGATVGVAVSVVEVPLTFGMSLLFAPVQGRRVNVNSRKKELIEKRLQQLDRIGYSLKKRDFMIPLTVGALSMGVIAGADMVLEYGLDSVGEIAQTQTAAAGAAAAQTAGEAAATQAVGTTATQTAGEAAATQAAGTTEKVVKGATKAAAREGLDARMEHRVKRTSLRKDV